MTIRMKIKRLKICGCCPWAPSQYLLKMKEMPGAFIIFPREVLNLIVHKLLINKIDRDSTALVFVNVAQPTSVSVLQVSSA